MNPCRQSNPCLTNSNPLLGFDSAAPDVPTEIGLGFGPSTPPPLNSEWQNPMAFVALSVPVTTPADQKTANLMAESQAYQQAAAGWTQSGIPVQTYQSASQFVTETCPDNSEFTFGVVAGLFTALTQAEADAKALSYCQRQIQLHTVCLTAAPPALCLNNFASVQITANGVGLGATGENLWELTGGELPAGMTFNGGSLASDSVSIAGTPTTAGTYAFSVKVTTPQGDFMEKVFSLTVFGVTSATAPTATAFVPYNFQLVWAGFNSPTFSVDPSSALPPGLTMSDGGLISGTPTVSGNYTVLVDVADSAADCQQEFAIAVSQHPVYLVTPDLTGDIAYFDGGASLPAGTYTISYVTGAVHSGSPAGWYLNCALCGVGGSGFYMRYPGSGSIFGDPIFPGTGGAYSSQAAVQAANNGASYTFTHTGGQIGLYNPGGFTAGSPNPTFALTQIA